MNLFSLRATDPRVLHQEVRASKTVDELNSVILARECATGPVVVGWGVHGGRYPEWVQHVVTELLPGDLQCLGVTKDGHPRHPLMVPYKQPLEPWGLERLT